MTEKEEIKINGWTFEETVKTAKRLMKSEKNMFKWDVLRRLRDFAENFYEEIKQYRAIGTPEEFRDALEKQIPQPPIVRGLGQRYCPICKCGGANDLYCSKCGQKLRD